MSDDEARNIMGLAKEIAASQNYFRDFHDASSILTEAQFSRRDILEITGLSEAQLKNTLDRNLVRLHSQHNPGTGRRRMFTGGDCLKIVTAHTMSAIGFPLKWSYLVADDVFNRAMMKLHGAIAEPDLTIATYPMTNGDWARVVLQEGVEHKLPPAVQILQVDRIIDETLAKLNAVVNEEPMPVFDFFEPEPTPDPYGPEDNFMRKWIKDDQGRDLLVGLSFDESEEFKRLEEFDWKYRLAGDGPRLSREDANRLRELRDRHEMARLQRIGEEMRERDNG